MTPDGLTISHLTSAMHSKGKGVHRITALSLPYPSFGDGESNVPKSLTFRNCDDRRNSFALQRLQFSAPLLERPAEAHP